MPSLVSLSISVSLSDPPGSSPITAAVQWLQDTLLGTIALTIAIVAVASVGLMMLTGRVEVRRGLTVIGGCFILFGVGSIVAGIQTALWVQGSPGEQLALPESAAVVIPEASPRPRDPYAGASLPPR